MEEGIQAGLLLPPSSSEKILHLGHSMYFLHSLNSVHSHALQDCLHRLDCSTLFVPPVVIGMEVGEFEADRQEQLQGSKDLELVLGGPPNRLKLWGKPSVQMGFGWPVLLAAALVLPVLELSLPAFELALPAPDLD